MDVNVLILVAAVLVAMGVAFSRDRALPWVAIQSTGRLLGSVWIELTLGFLLAGLIDVLVSPAQMMKWLGDGQGLRGILIGWVIGILLPGGPYLLFPTVASLFNKGVGAGPLLTLVAAKTSLNLVRTLTYEAPLLGWPLTLSRLLPTLLVPPVMGIAGQFIYKAIASTPPPP